MPDPLPYNVTISSQSAVVQYAPARDGALTAGWNVTYSSGTANTGFNAPQGVGTDSHQTTHDGATMQLSWVGTAVYLYGNATGASYSIDVDGSSIGSSEATVPQGGLLGSRMNLSYGRHTVTLTVHGTVAVSFQYAELTTGVGYIGYVFARDYRTTSYSFRSGEGRRCRIARYMLWMGATPPTPLPICSLAT